MDFFNKKISNDGFADNFVPLENVNQKLTDSLISKNSEIEENGKKKFKPKEMQIRTWDQLRHDFEKWLYEGDHVIVSWLGQLEEKTNQPRQRFVYGLLGCAAIYLIVGHWAALVCNLSGFLYPAWASIIAIRTADKEDDTQWLIYWTVFGLCSIIDFASDKIMGFFPIYWLFKSLFFLWLYCPMTHGAEKIYRNHVSPLMDRYGPSITADMAAAKGEAMGLADQAIEATQPSDPSEPSNSKGSSPETRRRQVTDYLSEGKFWNN